MRKLTSVISLMLATFFVVGCSSNSNKEFEQASAETLFDKGQTLIQKGNYSAAIRYLDAVATKGGQQSQFGEQTQLSLIYAQYKVGEYYQAIDTAERFVRNFPESGYTDYVFYLAALSNARLGDNFIQDFFGVNRSSRSIDTIRNAYGSFQTLVQNFPNSKYVPEAQQWMAYLKNRLAEHELSIVKFYDKRKAYVAVVNRVEEMIRFFPDTKATIDALPYMKTAFEQMALTESAEKTAELIEANKSQDYPAVTKPEYGAQF